MVNSSACRGRRQTGFAGTRGGAGWGMPGDSARGLRGGVGAEVVDAGAPLGADTAAQHGVPGLVVARVLPRALEVADGGPGVGQAARLVQLVPGEPLAAGQEVLHQRLDNAVGAALER